MLSFSTSCFKTISTYINMLFNIQIYGQYKKVLGRINRKISNRYKNESNSIKNELNTDLFKLKLWVIYSIYSIF